MIFSRETPLGTIVTLKRSTWEEKIINLNGNNDTGIHGSSHLDMLGHEALVEDSVVKPHQIVRDLQVVAQSDGSDIYLVSETRLEYYRMVVVDSNQRLIKTVVEMKDSEHGEVVTAHWTKRVDSSSMEGRVVYET